MHIARHLVCDHSRLFFGLFARLLSSPRHLPSMNGVYDSDVRELDKCELFICREFSSLRHFSVMSMMTFFSRRVCWAWAAWIFGELCFCFLSPACSYHAEEGCKLLLASHFSGQIEPERKGLSREFKKPNERNILRNNNEKEKS